MHARLFATSLSRIKTPRRTATLAAVGLEWGEGVRVKWSNRDSRQEQLSYAEPNDPREISGLRGGD